MSVNEGPAARDVEDLGLAVHGAASLDPATNYSIQSGHDGLNFSSLDAPDPVFDSATAVEKC